jgi:hypothetical protein
VSQSTPPSPSPPGRHDPGRRPKRPRYLTVSLVLVWTVGLFGSANGCQAIDILRRPSELRTATSTRFEPEAAKKYEVLIDAVLANRKVTAPLAAGELILGSLVMLCASLALVGRGRARGLLVQALVAYAAFLPIDYALRRPVRAAQIEGVLLDPKLAPEPGMDPAQIASSLRPIFWAAARGALALELGVLALGLFTLTRPRVEAFFASNRPADAPGKEP